MNCQCQGIEQEFNQDLADKELSSYEEKGPKDTTRLLIDALIAEGVDGLTLLDIGGGVGVIQYELLQAGASHVTSVDASTAYLDTARREAARRGLTDKVDYLHGDFVDLSEELPEADIVTLDRVICCYDAMESLVRLSAEHSRKLYGAVFPRDTWWVKIGITIINMISKLRKSPFRSFAHSTRDVEAILSRSGFKQVYHEKKMIWQVFLYSR